MEKDKIERTETTERVGASNELAQKANYRLNGGSKAVEHTTDSTGEGIDKVLVEGAENGCTDDNKAPEITEEDLKAEKEGIRLSEDFQGSFSTESDIVTEETPFFQKHWNNAKKMIITKLGGVDQSKMEAVKEENKALKNKIDEWKEIAEQRSLFVGSLSHEIRTPLNAILGFAQLLSDPDTSKEERNYFQKIITASGQSLLMLINDIIDFTKSEAKQLKLRKEDFNPQELLSIVKEFAKQEKNLKKPDASIDIDTRNTNPNGESIVHGDRGRIQQVLINFITNAIKFTDEGTISIGYEEQNGGTTFSVKDTGTGIDSKAIPTLFNYYAQDETTLKKNKEGTGLGLAISEGIVTKHGGKIWVESEKGKGSTFYFTIPHEKKVS